MGTDDEKYTEKEMLEFARGLCTKIWRTCLFLSLVDSGRISKKIAVEWHGCGEIDLMNCLNKFVKERRAMQLEIRAFRDEQRKKHGHKWRE